MFSTVSTYYYALVGGIAALLGWFAAEFAVDLFAGNPDTLLLQTIIKTVILGGIICACLCSRERTMLVGLSQGVKDGAIGAIVGIVAGIISGLLGYIMFKSFGQNILGFVMGYSLLGMFIGFGEGLKWAKSHGLQRSFRGLIGGAIGGCIAAIFYYVIISTISSMFGGALAMILLGALIGFSIAQVVLYGHMAVLEVIQAPKNKLVGQKLPLGSAGPRDVIGRDPNLTMPIITDDRLALEHAEIITQNRDYIIHPLTGEPPHRPGRVFINNQPIVGDHILQEGDRITVGDTILEFHRNKKALTAVTNDGAAQPVSQQDRAQALYRH